MFGSKYDADKNFSYMDGIPVKISEQYKPPKKISVPSGVLNKQKPEVEEYDFRLERSIINKMDKFRDLRRGASERRRQRLEKENHCGNGENKILVSNSEALSRLQIQNPNHPATQQVNQPSVTVSVSQQEVSQNSSYHNKKGETGMLPHVNPILTPIPVGSNNSYHHQTELSRSFNISDFESDTSSPFDNMELKTINDIEELAHVLQPNNCDISSQASHQEVNLPLIYNNSPASSFKKAYDINPLKMNGMNSLKYNNSNNLNTNTMWPNYNVLYHHNNYCGDDNNHSYATWTQNVLPSGYNNPNFQSYVVQRLDHLETDYKPPQQLHHLNQVTSKTGDDHPSSDSVPDIIQELALELNDKRALDNKRSQRNLQPTRPASIGPTEDELNAKSSLPNPLNELSPSSRELTKKLSEMGFPIARIARAVKLFNNDGNKVFEFLCQVQLLEEKGYPPDRAEIALITNEYDFDKTVKYLEILKKLLVLGFEEKRIVDALTVNDNDINKTIKHLETLNKLLDLGFAEENVVEALKEHSNNFDKALESLLS